MSKSKQKKSYASVKSPTIEAVTSGFFRFANEAQALARLEAIRDTFIISRLPEGEEAPPPDALRLWIRGFNVTPEEKEQGYTGNYALIRVRNTNDTKYTLVANKLPTDKKYHPQRKRTKSRHPNWGHPILRAIKKKKIYSSLEETQAEILRLHEEYPEVSIPCTGKMYIMIYQKTKKGDSPIKKWVLEVKAADEGGFYFNYSLNTYSAPKDKRAANKKQAVKDDTAAVQNQPDGYFTSMVQLKRARRKKPSPLAAVAATGGTSTATSTSGENDAAQ